MSHHSSIPPHDPDPARTAMSEQMRKIFGEFPDGKLSPDDEGALSLVIGEDAGRVVLRFPKPVAWIGFTPQQALEIAEALIYHARKCGAGVVPLVLRVGDDKP